MQFAVSRTTRYAVGVATCLAVLVESSPAFPCTAFLTEQQGGHYFGKSYDWHTSCGLVTINKRGIAKRALVLSGDETPAEWTSSHASVTFNQYGCEFPNGGMNDAGLAIEIAWLDSTEYPSVDERPMVNELQWIQYALDNFGSVAELVAAASDIRVSPAYAEVHYLACDSTGACAAFEYLDGALVITDGEDLLVDTLTNNTYATSAAFLVQHDGFGGDEPIPTSSSSLDRFVRASALALQPSDEPIPDPGFAILDSVSQGSFSTWNIVYDLDNLRAYFRTYAVPTIKRVDLSTFDPDCTSDTMILDIDTQATGDVSGSFEPYTYAANTDLVDEAFAPIIDYVPSGAPEIAALYPDAQQCTISDDDPDDPDDPDNPDDPSDPTDPDDGGGCSAGGHGSSPGSPVFLLAAAIALALIERRRAR